MRHLIAYKSFSADGDVGAGVWTFEWLWHVKDFSTPREEFGVRGSAPLWCER